VEFFIILSSTPPIGGVTALLLVAGVGRRLNGLTPGPKVLLDFGGQTLLERHLRALLDRDVAEIALTVGHHADAIRREVARLGLEDRVRLVDNPRYREGSVVSLQVHAERLRAGRPVVLMDGDVLYDPRMLDRLLAAPAENVLLLDPAIEPGDEPVKICLRGQTIVDFRKKPDRPHDWHGESVGFFRFSPAMAAALADRADAYVAQGAADQEYEEAIRDLILAHPDRFAATAIGDLAWTEIDFPADVARARDAILPRLES
jgi:choline kinase